MKRNVLYSKWTVYAQRKLSHFCEAERAAKRNVPRIK